MTYHDWGGKLGPTVLEVSAREVQTPLFPLGTLLFYFLDFSGIRYVIFLREQKKKKKENYI